MPVPQYIEHDGHRLTLREWSERLGVPYATLRSRRDTGRSIAETLSTKHIPAGPKPAGKSARRVVYEVTHGGWGIDLKTPYADDIRAHRFVETHPEGATYREVGAALGISCAGAAYIEAQAIKHFIARAKLVGMDLESYELGARASYWDGLEAEAG